MRYKVRPPESSINQKPKVAKEKIPINDIEMVGIPTEANKVISGKVTHNPNQEPLEEYLGKLLKKGETFYSASTFSKIKPGKVYEYSNIGAALCALVIESAANKPFNMAGNLLYYLDILFSQQAS